MKNINTLVEDIHSVFGKVEREGLDLSRFSTNIQAAYNKQAGLREPKERDGKVIYFSELGDVCPRRMWYKFHESAKAEEIAAPTKIKFLYGDILEELVLQLARDAGHEVCDEQRSVEYAIPSTDWRIRGRIDAIVDGVVVDVKSVTKYSEMKFKEGLSDDPFGYYGQLNGYAAVLKNSGVVKNDEMGFLTIQKELGHIGYWPFIPDSSTFVYGLSRAIKAMDRPTPVEDRLPDVPASATSKNMKLCTNCSYCSFKTECWPELRGFAYSNKVEFLTKVVDLPRVPEIDLSAAGEEE